MKRTVRLRTTIIIAVLVFVITFVGTNINFAIKNIQSAPISRKLNEINRIVDRYYLNPTGETNIDYDTMADYAAYAYILGLGDRYSGYMNAEQAKADNEKNNGELTGVGVLVTQNADGLIEITEVYNNSPAQRAGLLPRDVVIEVEGKKVAEIGYFDAINKVLGEAGTDAHIVIKRADEIIPFTITRSKINIDAVTYRMLENNIGYIRIREFNNITHEQFKLAYETLSKEAEGGKLSGIVFDMRNNLGGGLNSIVNVLDEILPEGVIVKLVSGDGKEEVYKSDAREIDVPMTVLTNENTASAAELFAGSLREYNKAKLVGKTTYGKGCAVGIFRLSDGSEIMIVNQMYYTASGANFEEVGVEPDYIVEMPDELRPQMFNLDENTDPQLRKALDILEGK